VTQGQLHPRAAAREDDELADDGRAAPDVGRDRRAGDAETRKRAEPEDEARPEDDVQEVSQPQHPHRDGGIAGAAKDRVQHEQEQDGRVAAKHHAGEAMARCDDGVGGSHHAEKGFRAGRREHRDPDGEARPSRID
jgi:hypothetical protein